MNIFDIEHRRGVVHQELAACTTPIQKLFVLKEFFDILLEQNNPAVLESYAIEFLETYVSALYDYSPLYLHTEITEQILNQIRVLLSVEFFSPFYNKLQEYHNEIFSKQNHLNKYLAVAGGTGKLYVKVIELNENEPGEFRKQMPSTKVCNYAKKNYINTALIIIILFICTYLFLYNIVNKSAAPEIDKTMLYVKNKSGKLLFKKEITYDELNSRFPVHTNTSHQLYDINNDGFNELILICDIENTTASFRCTNSKQEVIWEYIFKHKKFKPII